MKLYRKIEKKLNDWLDSDYALMIFGSRQVGKTYIIRDFIENNFKSTYYLNLYQNVDAIETIINAKNDDDFILRLTSLSNGDIEDGTCIFIDEIQEYYTYIQKNNINKYFDLMTASKFIVEKKKYRIIYSGSLLRLELDEIISNPVGYMLSYRMYPMDFEEFLIACNVKKEIIEIAKKCFEDKEEIPDYIHKILLEKYNKYILIGGMPKAVSEYLDKNSFIAVEQAHNAIESFNRKDIIKYANDNEKLKIKEIYELVATELNSISKRFIFSHIPNHRKNDNEQLSFTWLNNAGVTIPVYCVNAPKFPLIISSVRNKLKLFHEDVGILTYLLMDAEAKINVLNNKINMNYGAIFENAVAQSLYAHGFEKLYYYNSKKYGEIDFVIEINGKVIPMEIKSGKEYDRHLALNNVLNIKEYEINEAYVFYNGNIQRKDKITYYPIYCIDFVHNIR